MPQAQAARVGIVVTDDYRPGDGDYDTGPLIEALSARGVPAEPVVWHRWPSRRDTRTFDLLVLRTPWNYAEKEREFRSWLRDAGTRTRVLNSPKLVTWNLDKAYLHQLEQRGIAQVPTTWVRTAEQLRDALAQHGEGWVVIKPSVSAGAIDTELLQADSERALALGQRILDLSRTVMVQPEIPELSQGLEKALYFIGGEHTHTIAKGALLERGGGFIGGRYQENPQVKQATAEEIAFGRRVIEACAEATGTALPLYGRIDTVTSAEHGTVLLEAELFEPALNLHRVPQAADVLAAAIEERLNSAEELNGAPS